MPPLSRAQAAAVFAVGVALLALHALHYWGTWTDDAYITLRYAWRLWHDGELAFNPGERVEGLTNLGWGLLLAPFTGHDAFLASRVLGLLAGVATVGLLVDWCRRTGLSALAAAAAVVALVGPAWVPFWLVQGLETPAVMALLTLTWAHYARNAQGHGVSAGVGAALAPWVRPDAALAAVLLGAWHLVAPGPRFTRAAARAAGIIAGSALLLVAFKLAWTGHILPQTFSVKTQGDVGVRGWSYLANLAVTPSWRLPALLGLGVVAGLGRALRRDAAALPALLVLLWLPIMGLLGGDFMANFRLVVPVWPAACAGLALLVGFAERLAPDDLKGVAGAAILALVGAATLDPARVQAIDNLHQSPETRSRGFSQDSTKASWLPWTDPGWGQGLTTSMPFPAAWTLVHAPDRASVAYTDIGLISWASPRVDIVDLLGLTDPIMGGRGTAPQQWPYLQGRLDWMILDVGGGLWSRFDDRLRDDDWAVTGGCGSMWVFRNPRSQAATVPVATLRTRLDDLLQRSPDHREVHAAVAAELVEAGHSTLATDFAAQLRARHGDEWWEASRWMRCAVGEDAVCGAIRQPCGGHAERVTSAATADPARWPPPRDFGVPTVEVEVGREIPAGETPKPPGPGGPRHKRKRSSDPRSAP